MVCTWPRTTSCEPEAAPFDAAIIPSDLVRDAAQIRLLDVAVDVHRRLNIVVGHGRKLLAARDRSQVAENLNRLAAHLRRRGEH